MMKKLTSLILAALLVFSLAACAGTPEEVTAYEMYMKASKALEEAGSMEADVTAIINMTVEGESQRIDMNGKVKAITRSATDIDMDMNMTMSMLGQSIPVQYYYTGGYMYMDMMGMQIKVALPVDEALKQAGAAETLEFEESAVKDFTTQDTDAGKLIKFNIDADALSSVLEDQVADMTGDMSDMNLSYEFGDVALETVIDSDGALKTQKIIYTFTMTMDDTVVECDMEMTMDILNIGDDVKISFPDFSDYEEISEDEMQSMGL